MMPLSEIVGLAATVDPAGHSEVADVVGGAWGMAAGSARFCRSSASHVFRVSGWSGGVAYLRFVPDRSASPQRLCGVAALMDGWAVRGLPVVRPLPSTTGRLVETVDTPWGAVHAMVVAEAVGEQIDIADLSGDRAAAWGAALADLHRGSGDGPGLPGLPGLPGPFVELDGAGRVLADDPELVRAIARIRAELDRLPRDPGVFGVVHGDFELDNMAWQGDTPTAFDVDEAARCWFAADVIHALRDLGPTGRLDHPTGRAFLAGYRQMRDLTDAELGWTPLFVAAHAAATLARLRPALDMSPSTASPPWLGPLRTRLEAHLAALRGTAVGTFTP